MLITHKRKARLKWGIEFGQPTSLSSWRHVSSCDQVLPTAEFAYNSSVNHSTGRSPIEIVLEVKPRQSVDLSELSIYEKFRQDTDSFSKQMFDLHDKV